MAEVQQCQNGACDLDFDLENNEVKVQRARNFNWHRSISLGPINRGLLVLNLAKFTVKSIFVEMRLV